MYLASVAVEETLHTYSHMHSHGEECIAYTEYIS